MGLDYRFHLVSPVAAADVALRALAQELRPDDHGRLMAALPWTAANARVISWRGSPIWERAGVLSLARREQDRSDAFCFHFRVHSDDALQIRERTHGVHLPRMDGEALVPCWTSIAAGARLFVISATPVSYELRRVCEASEALLAPWQRVAEAARPHALFLDSEPQHARTLLYPQTHEVTRPGCAEYELADHSLATDAYWIDSLARAEIVLPPTSSPPSAPPPAAHDEV